jgi:hypothetical protein
VLEAAQRLEDQQLREHANEADAVIVGRIVGLEKAGRPSLSEHDPDWWRATIEVEHTEKGDVGERVQVLYPSSGDVRWARAPKLHSGQHGLWILHATEGDDAALAPYRLLDAEDAQPADEVDRLRSGGD